MAILSVLFTPESVVNGQEVFLNQESTIGKDQELLVNQEDKIEDQPEEKKCRVLSLSGGGAKGAYEVGALHSLANMLDSPESHYDVVSGVSVGSINAAGAGLFGLGEEKEMADFLLNIWTNLTSSQVWKFWKSPNPIAGITSKGGFLDNQPLHDLLVRLISSKDAKYKKRVLVSANDA